MNIRPNRVKQKLADGGIAYIISGLTDADGIDAFGPNGFDGIWLEGEHGPINWNLQEICPELVIFGA